MLMMSMGLKGGWGYPTTPLVPSSPPDAHTHAPPQPHPVIIIHAPPFASASDAWLRRSDVSDWRSNSFATDRVPFSATFDEAAPTMIKAIRIDELEHSNDDDDIHLNHCYGSHPQTNAMPVDPLNTYTTGSWMKSNGHDIDNCKTACTSPQPVPVDRTVRASGWRTWCTEQQ